MKHSLETKIAALLSLATPTNLAEAKTCDPSPVVFLGNSYIVALKKTSRKPLAKKWGVGLGNLVIEDNNPNTNDNTGRKTRCSRKVRKRTCKTRRGKRRCRTYTVMDRSRCDIISFSGRTVYDMYTRLPDILKELDRLGSHRVVLFEGPNSLNPGKKDDASVDKRIKRIGKVLRLIVNNIKNHEVNGQNVEIYLAKMPNGVGGYSSNLDFYSISMYNNMLENLGATDTIDLSDIAWKQGKLHGYQPPFTYQQTLAGIHDKINPSCGYSKHPKSHFDQKWIQYQRCVADRKTGKRKSRCKRYK